jgi:membrane-bound lytic murein transglycosylase A
MRLEAVSFDALPGWAADDQDQSLQAFRQSCAAFARQPATRALGGQIGGQIGGGQAGGRIGAWRAACAAAGQVPAGAARRYFETWFRPYRVLDDGDAGGLFTGYFEPELHGSWQADARYRVPLYRRPPDLVTADLGKFFADLKGRQITGRVDGGRLTPYASRGEIDDGALAGQGLELMWVDDPVDAFFLQVQGSGRVVMADGQVVRVGFAGRNGRPYRSIGRELIERGEIAPENMSMQAIRAWLAARPDEAPALLRQNGSYVFFRILEGPGPIGAQGVALTPGRSLAVDRTYIPLGVPIWLDTTDPLDPEKPLRRLVVAQDTGGAIKGPVRGDLFWGFGARAAAAAGRMKSAGGYYLLLPKTR